jgi:polysaccharide pyruvyl transferase WcaK-like protein
MKARPARIMLLGSYGQTNLGDDLLLRNYLQYFSALGCRDPLVSVSRADLVPASVRREHTAATFFELYQTSVLRLLKMVLAVDAIVYGGGSVYKELYASTRRGRYRVITRVMLQPPGPSPAASALRGHLLRREMHALPGRERL